MRTGGFLKNSLIDWEGKTVSVIFTKGCNFRCGYCHNPALVIPELINNTDDIPEDFMLSYLMNRKGWIDGVVISGGEPTIHKDLPDFLCKIRQLGFSIKLDTNGTNPVMIKNLIDDKLINYVSMDIKTSVKYPEYQRITNCNDPELINNLEESINTIRSANIQYQFRTTLLPHFHSDDILIHLKNRFKNDPYSTRRFRDGVLVSSWLSSLNFYKY